MHNALEGRGRTEVKAVADHLLGIIQELKDHLDYRGWGNSWECRIVSQPGGLRDRVEALLKKAVTP